jgi:patatin-like phospholipase/acyl hydrolase
MAESYRILAIDGGGVRGAFAARLLERLDERAPGFAQTVDLLAGTSTGAIIALGLASGLRPSALRELYEKHAREVFAPDALRTLVSLGGLVHARHDRRHLQGLLTEVFGERRLGDLPKRVLIASVDLDSSTPPPRRPVEGRPRWKAKFFHNYPGSDSDGEERIVDVALRSSAAPIFFSAYQGYVDGGLAANNPSMAAVAQAIDPPTGGQRLADLRLFSVSTGTSPQVISKNDIAWGVLQWGTDLIQLMIDGSMDVADFQCARLLGEDHYHRLDPDLPEPVVIDDAKRVPDLLRWAGEADLTAAEHWIRRHFFGRGEERTDSVIHAGGQA